MFPGLVGFGAGFVLAGDGGVEAAEGRDGLDRIVGAEGEGDAVVEEGVPGVGVAARSGPRRASAQFMSVSRWVGCMEAMTPSCCEAVEVAGADDLRVLDAVAEVGG